MKTAGIEAVSPSEKQIKYFKFISERKNTDDIYRLCLRVSGDRTKDYRKLYKNEIHKAISELLQGDRIKAVKEQVYNVLISLPQRKTSINTTQNKGEII